MIAAAYRPAVEGIYSHKHAFACHHSNAAFVMCPLFVMVEVLSLDILNLRRDEMTCHVRIGVQQCTAQQASQDSAEQAHVDKGTVLITVSPHQHLGRASAVM